MLLYLKYLNDLFFYTGVCETGYKGTDCNQCDTGYYGDGTTCTTCGTHKTTPASGTAATATDCKLIHFGWYSVIFYQTRYQNWCLRRWNAAKILLYLKYLNDLFF